MISLEETLQKMYDSTDENNFNALVEKMKRKAEKGLLEGVTPADIEIAANKVSNKEESNISPDFSNILSESFISEIAEITEAEKYYERVSTEELDAYLDTLTEDEEDALLTYCYLCEVLGTEETNNFLNLQEGHVWDGIKNTAKAAGRVALGVGKKGLGATVKFGKTVGMGIANGVVTAGKAIASVAPGAAIGAGLVGAGILAHKIHKRRKIRQMTESVDFDEQILPAPYKEFILSVLSEADENIDLDENNLVTKELLNYIITEGANPSFNSLSNDPYSEINYSLLEDLMNEADIEDAFLEEQSDQMFKAKHDVDNYVAKKNIRANLNPKYWGDATKKSEDVAKRVIEKTDEDEELSSIKNEISAEMHKDPVDRKKIKELYKKYKMLYKKKHHALKKSAKEDRKADKYEDKKLKNNLYEMSLSEVLYE